MEFADRRTAIANKVFEAAREASETHDATIHVFKDSEAFGWHLFPAHFYSPLPNISGLDSAVWQQRFDALPGIQWPEDAARRTLTVLGLCGPEIRDLVALGAQGFDDGNTSFSGSDAALLYAIVRARRPRRMVEIGSGNSTAIALHALAANGTGTFTAIEPYPSAMVQGLADAGRITLVADFVQKVPYDVFTALDAGDILFIDSSHVSKIGSDVNHEILQILPRLKPGVMIHFHDIFLPGEYPESWVRDLHLFWNEQYVLAAFMAFNSDFRTYARSAILGDEPYAALYADAFGEPARPGCSFWIERVR